MSDSIANDCLVHYNSQHIQVRKDFFDLCSYDKSQYNTKANMNGNIIKDEPNQECMAKILRIIETFTNTARSNWYLKAVNASKEGFKVPPEPPEHLIPLAYSAICSLLYNTYGESTVRNSVAALIQMGYIKRYQQNTGSIPCYALNIQTLQEALYQQAQDQAQNTLLNSTPILKKRGRPSKDEKKGVENAQMGVENNIPRGTISTPPSVEFNTTNIRDKKDVNKEKERETPPVTPPPSPQRNSLSLSPEKSSLHAKLTDQEADFWTRWCAIAKSPDLNETAYTHVVALAGEITSTAGLQSLYDFEYDRLRELTKAQGKGDPLPPRLGNLVKALPEWRQTQARRKQEKEQDQEAHEHIPGSGSITNWTQARLAGNQPTINYEPLPPVHKVPKDLKRIGNIASTLSPELQERIKQAREKRQTGA